MMSTDGEIEWGWINYTTAPFTGAGTETASLAKRFCAYGLENAYGTSLAGTLFIGLYLLFASWAAIICNRPKS